MDVRTSQPRTERALGGGDDLTRPLITDQLSDQGMVHAEKVGRQLHHPQLNLTQYLFMVCWQRRAWGTPGAVRLERLQPLLDPVEAARHLDEG